MQAMLTADGCLARRRRLWNALDPKPDLILVADPQHVTYLSNYFASPFVFRSTNAGAVLVLTPDGRAILVCDSMVQVFADEAHVDEVVAPVWYNGKSSAPHREALLLETARRTVERLPGRRMGIELACVPAGLAQVHETSRGAIEYLPVDAILHGMKREKDPDEIEVLRQSMAAGEAGFAAALAQVRPGMTEMDVFHLVQRASCDALGYQVGIYGDFVSGPRCEKVGGPPSPRVIEKGDLFLLDYSVIVRGYRGDFANTFVVGSGPTGEQRRLFEACHEAMAVGESKLRAGANCAQVDHAVRDVFAARHLLDNFGSHVGHGLGLGHPDPPYLVPQSTDSLVAGDVVTLEPGQYIAGVAGMRIERNYLVTESGFDLMTHHEIRLEQA